MEIRSKRAKKYEEKKLKISVKNLSYVTDCSMALGSVDELEHSSSSLPLTSNLGPGETPKLMEPPDGTTSLLIVELSDSESKELVERLQNSSFNYTVEDKLAPMKFYHIHLYPR